MPQRPLPTNRQVFGPPKDVFKPTGAIPKEKPEPMSTRTSYTLPSQRNFQNKNQDRRNEMYQFENGQDQDEYYSDNIQPNLDTPQDQYYSDNRGQEYNNYSDNYNDNSNNCDNQPN